MGGVAGVDGVPVGAGRVPVDARVGARVGSPGVAESIAVGVVVGRG